MVVGVTKRSWRWLSGLKDCEKCKAEGCLLWSENSARVQACSINDLTHMNCQAGGPHHFYRKVSFDLIHMKRTTRNHSSFSRKISVLPFYHSVLLGPLQAVSVLVGSVYVICIDSYIDVELDLDY